MTYAVLTARLALAGVLLVSAVAKVRSFQESRDMLDGLLRRLPRSGPGARRLAKPAAYALIAAEGATGLALLGPVQTVRPGLVVAAVLTAGFTAVAAWATVSRAEVSCACFGRPTARLGRRHVVRNAPLLGLAVLGLVGVGAARDASPELPAVVLCVVAAAVITLVTAFFDDIVDLVAGP